MPVNIQLEWTPNPNSIKYVVDQRLLPSGAVNITRKEMAEERSPLAARLMGIEGVASVMIGTNFVTITKGETGEWDELNDSVMRTLEDHLGANLPVVVGGAATSESKQNESETERKIREILEEEIRPAVMSDGGDIVLDRFEDGIVYLHMRGSCSGCPSSLMTLKMGIENRLRESLPEVSEVVPV